MRKLTKTKIKNKIVNSIFLDTGRKKTLLHILKDVSLEEQEQLFKLLCSEEVILKESLNRIVRDGKEKSVVGLIKNGKSLLIRGTNLRERKKILE